MNDQRDPREIDLERELVRYMAENRITRRMLLERIAKAGAFVALAPIIAACSGGAASASPSKAAASTPPSTGPTPAPTATPEPTPVPSPESELFIYNWDGYIGETTRRTSKTSTGSGSSTTSSPMPRRRSPRSAVTEPAAGTT